MDWFEKITGFREQGYEHAQANLRVRAGRLESAHGDRRPGVGVLEIPTLADLREQVAALDGPVRPGAIALEQVRGDVRALLGDPASARALFQVASQFNLLEMVGPQVTPEDGVTRYQHDHTQGPACAMAAGAATIYRNYLLPLEGAIGQTARRQVDCLDGLGRELGNDTQALWTMRNGYPMFTPQGADRIDAHLAGLDKRQREALMGHLRIGVHWDVEVTDLEPQGHRVSQAFCSALPVAYQQAVQAGSLRRLAGLVLEAAYEATLLAGVLNRVRTGCNLVYLTRLGGGAFGNDPRWIDEAIAQALARVGRRDLQGVMVSLR